MNALKEAKVQPKIISENQGQVEGSAVLSLKFSIHSIQLSPVLYDALYVVGGEADEPKNSNSKSVTLLTNAIRLQGDCHFFRRASVIVRITDEEPWGCICKP